MSKFSCDFCNAGTRGHIGTPRKLLGRHFPFHRHGREAFQQTVLGLCDPRSGSHSARISHIALATRTGLPNCVQRSLYGSHKIMCCAMHEHMWPFAGATGDDRLCEAANEPQRCWPGSAPLAIFFVTFRAFQESRARRATPTTIHTFPSFV